MAQPIQQLNRLFEKTKTLRTFNEDSLVMLMVCVRRCLEKEASKAAYSTLWFYCNWSFHSEISQGLTKKWLQRISEILNESPTTEWYTDQVVRILSFDKLRAELITLFQAKKLPLFLFDSASNWRLFVSLLCRHIIGSPLIRTDGPPLGFEESAWVMSLRIGSTKTDATLASLGEKEDRVYVILQGVNPNISEIFPLGIPESREEFLYP